MGVSMNSGGLKMNLNLLIVGLCSLVAGIIVLCIRIRPPQGDKTPLSSEYLAYLTRREGRHGYLHEDPKRES